MSTATLVTRQEDPIQRQKIALADSQVFVDERVDRSSATRSSLRDQWIAMVATLRSDTDLISEDIVTRNPAAYSLLDEYAFADYWRVLFRRSSQMREEELLDWDATIKTLSARPTTTILASIEYRGRAKPSPIFDPWD